MSLIDYGWTPARADAFAPHHQPDRHPGRVLRLAGDRRILYTEAGEREAAIPGRLGPAPPVVGDWVVFHEPATGVPIIEAILPRISTLSRKGAGRGTHEQVVAANLDTVLIVMGLDGDFNPRRLERFLTMVWESGATPVVVLNKRDQNPAWPARVADTETVAPGVPVHAISCLHDEGLEVLTCHWIPGHTVALIGSSGAGKSSIINRLAGVDRLRTGPVRETDERGRHTTTHRSLIRLPSGVLMIDNPGIRELQPWNQAGAGLERTFADIEDLARDCRFRDCGHGDEPGCAVRAAVERGALSRDRLANRHALQAELEAQALRRDAAAQRQRRKEWATIAKAIRRHTPRRL